MRKRRKRGRKGEAVFFLGKKRVINSFRENLKEKYRLSDLGGGVGPFEKKRPD